jgi:glycosyltransferase involved in cell wall biosynthesis
MGTGSLHQSEKEDVTQRNILFIAPLPPPITGQSLVSQVLRNYLEKYYNLTIINYNKESFDQGFAFNSRILEVVRIMYKIKKYLYNADLIYLNLSQSIAGNIKDILIYLLCFTKLSKMIVHLHGGGIRNIVFERSLLLFKVNKFCLKNLGAVIVLGNSLVGLFENIVPPERIHVVSNFVEDFLFMNENQIIKKFRTKSTIRVLFMSNLLEGKGHEELMSAYECLNSDTRKIIRIDFAGAFGSEREKKEFLSRLGKSEGMYYHGVVNGGKKKDLFALAHVFCLPTYYKYKEGQPVSILEAYASGCVVMTTNIGGIGDIFQHMTNGYEVKMKSVHSIKKRLEKICKKPDELIHIGLYNNLIAHEKYRKSIFFENMIKIFENTP